MKRKNFKETMKKSKDAKIIFSPQLANYLLQCGFEIIKLKPKHGNPNETVFVFRLVDGLYDSIEDWMGQKENEEYYCEEDK